MTTIMEYMLKNKLIKGSKNNPPQKPKDKKWAEHRKDEKKQWREHCKEWDINHQQKNKSFGGWRIDD